MTKSSEIRALTEVELELMHILWRLGEGTVNDVLAELPNDRQLAYTSVATILRILEKKNVLSTRKLGRAHVFVPMFDKAAYAHHSVHTLVQDVFKGTPAQVVRSLIETESISKQELRTIRKLIEQAERKSR